MTRAKRRRKEPADNKEPSSVFQLMKSVKRELKNPKLKKLRQNKPFVKSRNANRKSLTKRRMKRNQLSPKIKPPSVKKKKLKLSKKPKKLNNQKRNEQPQLLIPLIEMLVFFSYLH